MNSPDNPQPQQWYVRNEKGIKGPLPTGIVRRYILIGRITNEHELSNDKKDWKTLSELSFLVPDVMQSDSEDDFAEQRLQAAKRWADERMETPQGSGFHKSIDRRESLTERDEGNYIAHSNHLQEVLEKKRSQKLKVIVTSLFFASLLIAAVATIIMNVEPKMDVEIDCKAAAEPNVNWSNCQLEGVVYNNVNLRSALLRNINLTGGALTNSLLRDADVSYSVFSFADISGSDFSSARLIGATLKGANLDSVKFRDADLSYADLSGANIVGVDISGAKLDNAIWISGRECLPGSIGECVSR